MFVSQKGLLRIEYAALVDWRIDLDGQYQQLIRNQKTMTAATYDTPQIIHYSVDCDITARMLADTLYGIDGMSGVVGKVLSQLSGIPIRRTEVLITSFQVGSLEENVVYRFLFGKGKTGTANFEKFRSWVGIQPLNMNRILGIITTGLVGYVAYSFLSKSDDKKSEASVIHIENSFNAYGKELNLSPDEFLALLKDSVKDKQELSRSVIKIVRPDGIDETGALTIDGDRTLRLDKDALAGIPQLKDSNEAAEVEEDIDALQLVFRASDLDRAKVGWAAIAAELTENRLAVELGDDVNPMTIPTGKYVKADVKVFYKRDQFGNKTAKRLLVKRLVKEASKQESPAVPPVTPQD